MEHLPPGVTLLVSSNVNEGKRERSVGNEMHKRIKQQTRKARRPGIEEIEPRILYSADFAPALVPDASVDAHAEQRTVDSSGEFNQASTAAGPNTSS